MSAAIDLAFPFTERWLVQFSPANRVPSHGTTLFASSYAIDFVPVTESGRSGRFTFRSLTRPESPSAFPGFGRPILAPVSGTVVVAHDSEPDHDAHRGLPSISYMLSQRSRLAGGWPGMAGNHVFIETRHAVVALCHLQQGSVAVKVGQRVATGALVARCGNSGNSTEPHLHLQAMDGRDPASAAAVPFTFGGSLPRRGEIVKA